MQNILAQFYLGDALQIRNPRVKHGVCEPGADGAVHSRSLPNTWTGSMEG